MQNEPQLPIAPCYQSLFLLLTGAITVRLVSCEFEADTQHGVICVLRIHQLGSTKIKKLLFTSYGHIIKLK